MRYLFMYAEGILRYIDRYYRKGRHSQKYVLVFA